MPLEVYLFPRNLINNRILTKNNLVRWVVVPACSLLCSGGCGQTEMIKHIFLKCDFYSNVWHLGLHWLGIHTSHHEDIGSHAFQFGGTHVFRKEIRVCFQAIQLACIWVIWKEQNVRFFLTINKFFWRNYLSESNFILGGGWKLTN